MVAVGPNNGADNDALIHDARDARKHFGDLDAGNIGFDRVKFAANLARRFGLDLPHVLVGRSTAEVDVDDRFVAA